MTQLPLVNLKVADVVGRVHSLERLLIILSFLVVYFLTQRGVEQEQFVLVFNCDGELSICHGDRPTFGDYVLSF